MVRGRFGKLGKVILCFRCKGGGGYEEPIHIARNGVRKELSDKSGKLLARNVTVVGFGLAY